MSPQSIAGFIRQLREEAGLTRRQLALGAGYASGTPSKVERGEPTRRSTVRRLVAVVAEVLTLDGKPTDVEDLYRQALEVGGDTFAPETEFREWFAREEAKRDRRAVPAWALVADRDLRLKRAALKAEILHARLGGVPIDQGKLRALFDRIEQAGGPPKFGALIDADKGPSGGGHP